MCQGIFIGSGYFAFGGFHSFDFADKAITM